MTLNTFYPAHGLCDYIGIIYYYNYSSQAAAMFYFIRTNNNNNNMSKTMQAGMYIVVAGRDVEGDFIIKTHNRRVSCLSNVYNIILLLRTDSYRRCTDK